MPRDYVYQALSRGHRAYIRKEYGGDWDSLSCRTWGKECRMQNPGVTICCELEYSKCTSELQSQSGEGHHRIGKLPNSAGDWPKDCSEILSLLDNMPRNCEMSGMLCGELLSG
jgi:hypothetical protein